LVGCARVTKEFLSELAADLTQQARASRTTSSGRARQGAGVPASAPRFLGKRTATCSSTTFRSIEIKGHGRRRAIRQSMCVHRLLVSTAEIAARTEVLLMPKERVRPHPKIGRL
jgi:hypothetical protein